MAVAMLGEQDRVFRGLLAPNSIRRLEAGLPGPLPLHPNHPNPGLLDLHSLTSSRVWAQEQQEQQEAAGGRGSLHDAQPGCFLLSPPSLPVIWVPFIPGAPGESAAGEDVLLIL